MNISIRLGCRCCVESQFRLSVREILFNQLSFLAWTFNFVRCFIYNTLRACYLYHAKSTLICIILMFDIVVDWSIECFLGWCLHMPFRSIYTLHILLCSWVIKSCFFVHWSHDDCSAARLQHSSVRWHGWLYISVVSLPALQVLFASLEHLFLLELEQNWWWILWILTVLIRWHQHHRIPTIITTIKGSWAHILSFIRFLEINKFLRVGCLERLVLMVDRVFLLL